MSLMSEFPQVTAHSSQTPKRNSESQGRAYTELEEQGFVETNRCCLRYLSVWNLIEPLGWMPFASELGFVTIVTPIYLIHERLIKQKIAWGLWPFMFLFWVTIYVPLWPGMFFFGTKPGSNKCWFYFNAFWCASMAISLTSRFENKYAFDWLTEAGFILLFSFMIYAKIRGYSQERHYLQMVENIRELTQEEMRIVDTTTPWLDFLWPRSRFDFGQRVPYPPKLWAVLLIISVFVNYFAINLMIIVTDAWNAKGDIHIEECVNDSFLNFDYADWTKFGELWNNVMDCTEDLRNTLSNDPFKHSNWSYLFFAYFLIERKSNNIQITMIWSAIVMGWIFSSYVTYLQYMIFRKHLLDVFYSSDVQELESYPFSARQTKFVAYMSAFPLWAIACFSIPVLVLFMLISTEVNLKMT